MFLDDIIAGPDALAGSPGAFWQAAVVAAESSATPVGTETTTAAECTTRQELPERWSSEALAPLRKPLCRLVQCTGAELTAGIDALLLSTSPAAALELARRAGAFKVVLPEVESLVGFHLSASSHHKDLWAHTREVIGSMPSDADLRWAALLHDIGKISTRVVERPGVVTFWHHEAVGAWLAAGIMARLEMPPARAQRIHFVVAQHGRVNAYEPSWSDRAVRRLARDMGERMSDVLAFSRSDFTTKRTALRSRITRQLEQLESRLTTLAATDAQPRLPAGLGRIIASHTGLNGAPLGAALAWLADELVAGRVASAEAALVEHMAKRPEAPADK